ncbi:MAG: hypothetical protein JWP14_915 [Frankiales bacterium]|nr:hypothetical protein [Frankiales bacterium]
MGRRLMCGRVALLTGPVLGVLVVSSGVRIQSGQEKRLLGSWYAWSAPVHLPGYPEAWLVGAVVALVLLWVLVAWLVQTTPALSRGVQWGAWLWAAPFALAAPFLSRDVYAYVVQGAVMGRGLDPYAHAPSVLGSHDPLLQAVDPKWRTSAAPYGPLALRLAQLSTAVGGHGAGAFVVLRVLAVLSVVGVVLLLRSATPQHLHGLVTWLAMSPLTLLQLIAAVHWEAELGLLLVLALVLARRGRLFWAVLVAGIACEIKAVAAVVVAALVLDAWRRGGRQVLPQVGSALAAGAALAVLVFPVDPWGWLGNLHVATKAWSPYTPATTLFLLLGHLQPDHEALLSLCRYAVMVAAAVVVVLTLRRRERDVAVSSGVLLLAAIGALPTVWPWYVAPTALLVLIGAPRLWWWAAGLASTAALAALPIATEQAQRVSVAGELLAGIALVAVYWRSGRLRSARVSRALSASPPLGGH